MGRRELLNARFIKTFHKNSRGFTWNCLKLWWHGGSLWDGEQPNKALAWQWRPWQGAQLVLPYTASQQRYSGTHRTPGQTLPRPGCRSKTTSHYSGTPHLSSLVKIKFKNWNEKLMKISNRNTSDSEHHDNLILIDIN